MAFSSNAGSPVAFGTGQSSPADDRSLFLKKFTGEVLTAFTLATVTKGKFNERNIQGGKSAQFIRTGDSMAEYLTRGQEMMGNPYATGEVEITLDGLLVAHHALFDLDTLMSQFDIRGPMTTSMGQALAEVYDRNNYRAAILAARQAAVGPFPGGSRIVAADLLTSGVIDGMAWMARIREAKAALYAKKVPLTSTIYMAVPYAVFDALKYARDSVSGHFVNLTTTIQLAAAGEGANVTEAIRLEGVNIYPTQLVPNTNESAATSVYPKYRADYSKTSAVMWTPDAVGVLTLRGMSTEVERSARRQEDFIVTSQASGHGTLRAECAVEFALPAA
ncbi:hypothetical protein [Cupriavidus taiwanensis]|uniref:hypothetical protein n=1 Tax=Cupriavidus taiwanensis TaxID=164546 RepID=UPI000E10E9DB|nr:hypothetical protein [Cupriavidus taiwanensis]SPA50603.1 conserved protein of unknown function [Cupriavidus taiwanensis]